MRQWIPQWWASMLPTASLVAGHTPWQDRQEVEARIVVTGLVWSDAVIHCTGFEFVGCRFDRCVLVGVLNATECVINPGVTQ